MKPASPRALSVLLDFAEEPLAMALEAEEDLTPDALTVKALELLIRVSCKRHREVAEEGPAVLHSARAARAWVEKQRAPWRVKVRRIVEGRAG